MKKTIGLILIFGSFLGCVRKRQGDLPLQTPTPSAIPTPLASPSPSASPPAELPQGDASAPPSAPTENLGPDGDRTALDSLPPPSNEIDPVVPVRDDKPPARLNDGRFILPLRDVPNTPIAPEMFPIQKEMPPEP